MDSVAISVFWGAVLTPPDTQLYGEMQDEQSPAGAWPQPRPTAGRSAQILLPEKCESGRHSIFHAMHCVLLLAMCALVALLAAHAMVAAGQAQEPPAHRSH